MLMNSLVKIVCMVTMSSRSVLYYSLTWLFCSFKNKSPEIYTDEGVVTERERERDLQLLVHTTNGHSGQRWTRVKLGAQNSTLSLLPVARPSPGPSCAAFSGAVAGGCVRARSSTPGMGHRRKKWLSNMWKIGNTMILPCLLRTESSAFNLRCAFQNCKTESSLFMNWFSTKIINAFSSCF